MHVHLAAGLVQETQKEWVKCFTVYANTLCAHNPARGADKLGYLFVVASSLQEFSLPAVPVYDIAKRKYHSGFICSGVIIILNNPSTMLRSNKRISLLQIFASPNK